MSDPGFSLSDQFDRAATGIPLPPRERWLPAPHERWSGRIALGGLAAAAAIAAIAAVTLYGIGARPGQVLAPQAPVEASPRPFGDLVRAAGANPYKVTYRVSSTSGGDAISATQTWYLSGSRIRMDLSFSDPMVPAAMSIYVLSDGRGADIYIPRSFSCFSTEPAGLQCHILSERNVLEERSPFGASPGATFDERIRADPDSFGARFIETRSIAGTNVACYAVSGGAAGFTEGTICYTDSGVPLLLQFEAPGIQAPGYPAGEPLNFTMEATSFGVATDADFRLPAPPQGTGP
jgi:hypothetical protein